MVILLVIFHSYIYGISMGYIDGIYGIYMDIWDIYGIQWACGWTCLNLKIGYKNIAPQGPTKRIRTYALHCASNIQHLGPQSHWVIKPITPCWWLICDHFPTNNSKLGMMFLSFKTNGINGMILKILWCICNWSMSGSPLRLHVRPLALVCNAWLRRGPFSLID